MSQSTLQVTYDDLRRELGRFLGWGRDPSSWSADQVTDGTDILKAGLSMFYWPVDEQGQGIDHEWSFLTLRGQMTTIADQYEYGLPDDFGAIDGRIYYTANTYRMHIDIVDVDSFYEMRMATSGTGLPTHAAFEPKRMSGLEGQKWHMLLYPTPGGEYSLTYGYNVLPDALLDTTREHAYGGAMHRQALIECVLGAAELMINMGPDFHYAEARRQIQASIARDSRGNRGEVLGYNGDNSERRWVRFRHQSTNSVTYPSADS